MKSHQHSESNKTKKILFCLISVVPLTLMVFVGDLRMAVSKVVRPFHRTSCPVRPYRRLHPSASSYSAGHSFLLLFSLFVKQVLEIQQLVSKKNGIQNEMESFFYYETILLVVIYNKHFPKANKIYQLWKSEVYHTTYGWRESSGTFFDHILTFEIRS